MIMGAQTVITHAPEQYLPSDGMTPCQFRFNPAKGRGTCATVGTPTVAVHVLATSLPVAPAGTHLCAYHSPYDVRTAPVAPPVPARGVSLAREGDPVSAPRTPVPAACLVNIGLEADESDWWGVPAYVVREWISMNLCEGAYHKAAHLSARLHSVSV